MSTVVESPQSPPLAPPYELGEPSFAAAPRPARLRRFWRGRDTDPA